MIAPILPERKVVASFYTQGGLANTNIRLQLSGTQTPLLLRVFTRDPSQAEKECRLYQRINGQVPSPKIYYYSPTNPVSGHPYSILQLVDGDRLETLVEGLDPSWSVEVGRSVGASLAGIHSIKFEQEGFLDELLNVKTPIYSGGHGLMEFAESCLVQDIVYERLGTDLRTELWRFIERESAIFDAWKNTPCLVHADFGGSNILVKRFPAGWRVTAVLDWEFALSGNPLMDFGNLLRDPLGSVEGFEEAVHEGYIGAGGTLPADWRKMSKLADLTAWLEFLTRPEANERLVADAMSVIDTTMAGWHQSR